MYLYIYTYIYMCVCVCVSEHKQNAYNDGNRAQPLKWLLKTLFLAIKKCTGFTIDVIWVNTKVCSVTIEPTQSSSWRVSTLEDSSVLLATEWWTSQKWSPSTRSVVSSTDESFKDETRLLLLWVGSLVTPHTFVFTHITSVVKPVHFFMARNRVSKSRFKGRALFPSLCAFCLCSDVYFWSLPQAVC